MSGFFPDCQNRKRGGQSRGEKNQNAKTTQKTRSRSLAFGAAAPARGGHSGSSRRCYWYKMNSKISFLFKRSDRARSPGVQEGATEQKRKTPPPPALDTHLLLPLRPPPAAAAPPPCPVSAPRTPPGPRPNPSRRRRPTEASPKRHDRVGQEVDEGPEPPACPQHIPAGAARRSCRSPRGTRGASRRAGRR